MIDQAAPAANAAAANTDPGKAAPVAATPEQPAAPKPGDPGTPEWLNPRLEQKARSARADLLKEIGVEDPEVLKRLVSESKARADAEKTASELLASEKKAREKAEADVKTYREALAARAEVELAKLTPEQQAFVEKTAGADPARRLSTIDDVRALVGSAKPAEKTDAAEKRADEQPPPAVKKVLPAPASTAPGGAPPGGQPPPPVDHLAVLERLDRENPMVAGRYYDKHRAAITHARAQKTAASASQ